MTKLHVPLILAAGLMLTSCETYRPTSREFDAPPERLSDAVRSVLSEGGEVSHADGTYFTGWQEDPEARKSWNQFGRPLRGESRYRITIEGNRVTVDARSRVFVSFGPHAHRWQVAHSKRSEERAISRTANRLTR